MPPQKKEKTMKTQIVKNLKHTMGIAIGAAVAAVFILTAGAFAGEPAPRDCNEFGHILAHFEDVYTRWSVGNITLPPDKNGNAVVDHIVLLPIPSTPGDGTAGHLDVTLNRGQAFFLPLLQELGTSYTDGTPSDPLLSKSYFKSFNVTMRIDGKLVVDNYNKMDYFTQFYFAPPVPLGFGNLDSIIWFQGFNILFPPFSVGKHTIRLDEKAEQPLPPNFGGATLEYHNTWTITVSH
jgi:hypothetical protein